MSEACGDMQFARNESCRKRGGVLVTLLGTGAGLRGRKRNGNGARGVRRWAAFGVKSWSAGRVGGLGWRAWVGGCHGMLGLASHILE